jgi:hypothetical protein
MALSPQRSIELEKKGIKKRREMKEKIQEKNLPLLSSFPFSLEICKRETELSGRHHPRNPICSKSLTIFVGYAFALK